MTKQIQEQAVLQRFKDSLTCQPLKAIPLLIPWFSWPPDDSLFYLSTAPSNVCG
ncbi:MAG: hypothetical protein OSB72_00625 [Gammaproteobacteria bacterium]|nr:hypothetical protein [Gammaproteobacteria bacterium]